MSRYRDPQLQVGENYSYLFNLRLNIYLALKERIHYVEIFQLYVEINFIIFTNKSKNVNVGNLNSI